MEDKRPLSSKVKRWSTSAWLDTSAQIAHPNGDIGPLDCNAFQREVSDILTWCHDNDRPARIIVLKPRRRGSSTVSVAAGYRRLQARRATGLIAGGAHFQGKKLFKMLEIFANTDADQPGTCTVTSENGRFANGSEMDRMTLANPTAGRAGGYQFLVITEMAFLSEEGVADAASVVSGLIKTVQHVPDTIIILESTANGATGDYYERWQKTITFDQFKRGRNGFVRVFYAWWQFPDLRMDPAAEGITTEADYSTQERDLADKWGLDIEQVAWMRWSIREECSGDFEKFCEDYPFDAESAFRKSGRGRFSVEGLDYQQSIVVDRIRTFGHLDHQPHANRTMWVQTSEQEARCVRWEEPKVERRYLVAVDPMTGASQTSGDDPDSHGVFVLRAGYVRNGAWIEPAVVARNMLVADGTRIGCWWDIDVLAEEVWRLARYYQAIVVPEINMDRGLVELLKVRGDVEIYRRELFNRREQTKTEAYGWLTDVRTREMAIENLARMVREAGRGVVGEGFEVRCPWAIKQMQNFVVSKSGRSEAAQGHHDDDVLAVAIGAMVLDSATPWAEPSVSGDWLPPDLRPRGYGGPRKCV